MNRNNDGVDMDVILESPLGLWAYIAGIISVVGFTWMLYASLVEEKQKPKD